MGVEIDFNVMCHKCGTVPQWWNSDYHYCRNCNQRQGHDYASKLEIDADKLLEFFEGDVEKTREFLRRTSYY